MVAAAYAFSHFAVDFGCAFAMFSCNRTAWHFLIYNFFAFALQMPLGLLADIAGKNKSFALLGVALTAVGCCLPGRFDPVVCLLGLGNALFHIGGGLDVLNISGNKAAPLGIFVSPGALGVYLGTLFGKQNISPLPVLVVLLLACGLILIFCRQDRLCPNVPVSVPGKKTLIPACLLFAVVALRSYGGGAVSFPWKEGALIFVCVLSVALGKALGGLLSDRFGAVPVSCFSLSLAALLFLLCGNAVSGLLALGLFNMTMPITLHALSQKMHGSKGFSFGLLTFALFLGFLPGCFGAPSIGGSAMAVISLLSVCLLVPCVKAGDSL